jgi:hypothetical protein
VAAHVPAAHLANLLSLPARQFAVVDGGEARARILRVTVARGRPRLDQVEIIDSHEEGFTTAEELREEVRRRLRENPPEAVVLVLPQKLVLRHVLDVPPGDAEQTRALVEREASNIGGLSESPWVFDAVRIRPFGTSAHPVAAALCRQDDLRQLLERFVEDERLIFDVRPAGDALAAAFAEAAPDVPNAVLIDLGARHTSVTLFVEGQAVFASAFQSGSSAFTEALAADFCGSHESAEVLKRTEPPPLASATRPQFKAAVAAWLAELERTIQDWQTDHPGMPPVATWDAYLSGGGGLQPGLAAGLSRLGSRPFKPWPGDQGEPGRPGHRGHARGDLATAWGALLLALSVAGPAPSLLPEENRAWWRRQRLWRALVSANLALAAMLAVAIGVATAYQGRQLAQKADWKAQASVALEDAREIRAVAEGYNAELEAFQPILNRQRRTVEALEVLRALQAERTNDSHWFVLLADEPSYSAGSNNFKAAPPVRGPSERVGPLSGVIATNAVPIARTFVAEVCLVPQGEKMRQELSDLVSELKRNPLFRNVDVLPAERRRELVATNLIFPERHFALELDLTETELLPPVPLPRLNPTNREPRGPLRSGVRREFGYTNGLRGPRTR